VIKLTVVINHATTLVNNVKNLNKYCYIKFTAYTGELTDGHERAFRRNRSNKKEVKISRNRFENPEEERGARWEWVASTTPRPLYPRETPSTH
jgi:hypothetical protein